jgi:hypothetical protein
MVLDFRGDDRGVYPGVLYTACIRVWLPLYRSHSLGKYLVKSAQNGINNRNRDRFNLAQFMDS